MVVIFDRRVEEPEVVSYIQPTQLPLNIKAKRGLPASLTASVFSRCECSPNRKQEQSNSEKLGDDERRFDLRSVQANAGTDLLKWLGQLAQRCSDTAMQARPKGTRVANCDLSALDFVRSTRGKALREYTTPTTCAGVREETGKPKPVKHVAAVKEKNPKMGTDLKSTREHLCNCRYTRHDGGRC